MLFHLLWRMRALLCQHEASKIKNTIVRNSFSSVVYTACNITHTVEKPFAALSVSSENFFPLLVHERAPLTVYYWDYTPFCPKRHFLQPSLIRVFAVCSVGSLGPHFASSGQYRLWSDWADAQADLSLHCPPGHFVGLVMPWLNVRIFCHFVHLLQLSKTSLFFQIKCFIHSVHHYMAIWGTDNSLYNRGSRGSMTRQHISS